MAYFRRRGKYSCPAVVRIGPTCASMLRRCSMVSAPGSTKCLSLLFVLRDVDEDELLASVEQDLPLSKSRTLSAEKILDDSDVAALFGLEMAETANSATPIPATPKRPQRSKFLKGSKAPPEAKTPAAKISKSPGATRTKSEPKWAALARSRKKRAKHPLQRSA